MLAVLTDPQPTYTIPMALENAGARLEEPQYAMRTVHGGVATGPLMGGNLSLVSALAGTPYAADFGQHPVPGRSQRRAVPDRPLDDPARPGPVGFDKAAGVMIGICDNCGPQGEDIVAHAGPDLRHAPAAAVDAGRDRLFVRPHPQPVHDPGGGARHARYRAQTVTLLEPAVRSESGVNIPADMIHYGMTKTAQLAISRGLAKLAVGSGVTVNAVLPGPTLSEGVRGMLQDAAAAAGTSVEEAATAFVREHRSSSLLQRPATVEEVANMIVYICSAQASATTGAALRVDGGVVDSIV
jgi:NAD(P)-dependent dehydrogenase (short-subunit alcohol dehydrogenase family)